MSFVLLKNWYLYFLRTFCNHQLENITCKWWCRCDNNKNKHLDIDAMHPQKKKKLLSMSLAHLVHSTHIMNKCNADEWKKMDLQLLKYFFLSLSSCWLFKQSNYFCLLPTSHSTLWHNFKQLIIVNVLYVLIK